MFYCSSVSSFYCYYCIANKESFLNQLAHVILAHNWYRSTSMCFHVYSHEYTCSACCHEFWTSLTRVILGQNWYGFTGMRHHVKNSWFHGKHVSTHQICSQNPVNSHTETRELSQLNSWIHLDRTCEITGRCLLGSIQQAVRIVQNIYSWTQPTTMKTNDWTFIYRSIESSGSLKAPYTLYSLADLFNRTPSQFLCKVVLA